MGDFLYISRMGKELTYEERIQWFISKYYESGMEYEGLLVSMKDTNLDSFQWYNETVSIPKYSNDGTKTTGHLTRQIMKLLGGEK